jgi:hypothetical protein
MHSQIMLQLIFSLQVSWKPGNRVLEFGNSGSAFCCISDGCTFHGRVNAEETSIQQEFKYSSAHVILEVSQNSDILLLSRLCTSDNIS